MGVHPRWLLVAFACMFLAPMHWASQAHWHNADTPEHLKGSYYHRRELRQEQGAEQLSTPPLPSIRVWTQEEARATNVTVAVKSSHFFGPYDRVVPNCTHTDGQPLHCVYIESSYKAAPEADAVWFHLPTICGGQVTRDAPHQLIVGMSMEASTYYTCMDDVNFMDQFDVEMTYRRCSHVQVPYFAEVDSEIQNRLFADPKPFEQKQDAIVYINSNCGALNGRNELVNHLMHLKQLPVHSWGACLRNKVAPNHHFDKVKVFHEYKFCIAMENSNTIDYVTEKIWQALESGCLPIYWGAPNIYDFVPTKESIINYNEFGSPKRLMDHLVMLSKDKAAYQLTQKWRYMPLDSLSDGFRKMVLMFGGAAVHSQCRLCQLIMNQRTNPTPLRQTHCLRNKTWVRAVKSNGSTWGPGSDELLKQPHAHRWSPIGVWDPLREAPAHQPRTMPDAIVGRLR